MDNPEKSSTPKLTLLTGAKSKRESVDMDAVRFVAMKVANDLQRMYPFYAWGVKPTNDGSCIDILLNVTGGDYGFTVHTKDVQGQTGRTKLLREAGGTLLESYNLERHKKTNILEAGAAMNSRGEYLPENYKDLG